MYVNEYKLEVDHFIAYLINSFCAQNVLKDSPYTWVAGGGGGATRGPIPPPPPPLIGELKMDWSKPIHITYNTLYPTVIFNVKKKWNLDTWIFKTISLASVPSALPPPPPLKNPGYATVSLYSVFSLACSRRTIHVSNILLTTFF